MGQNKKIKPALLVIDIQNTYLKYIPDKDKEAALTSQSDKKVIYHAKIIW